MSCLAAAAVAALAVDCQSKDSPSSGAPSASASSDGVGDIPELSDSCRAALSELGEGGSPALGCPIECVQVWSYEPCPAEPAATPETTSATRGKLPPYCYTPYVDADGDGVGHACLLALGCCHMGEEPPGVSLNGGDCDDNDPNRTVYGFVDADGDGRGAGEPVCTTSPLPSGFSPDGDDCDDEDPELFWPPHGDCNCSRFLEAAPTLEANPNCTDAADLVIADSQICANDGCYENLHIRVGNRGGAIAQAPIRIQASVGASTQEYVLDRGLAAGEVSAWLFIPGLSDAQNTVVSIEAASELCDANNGNMGFTLHGVCIF